jgi:hypothetical protein
MPAASWSTISSLAVVTLGLYTLRMAPVLKPMSTSLMS